MLFIAYPLVTAEAVSIMAGVSLVAFGLVSMFNGFSLWSMVHNISLVQILLGAFLILLGFLFFINLAALAFVVSYSFYFIAFILIFLGISGLIIKESALSKWGSILIVILGIIFLLLAVYSITDPLFISILVGICLIVRGVIFFTIGKAVDEVNRFEETQ